MNFLQHDEKLLEIKINPLCSEFLSNINSPGLEFKSFPGLDDEDYRNIMKIFGKFLVSRLNPEFDASLLSLFIITKLLPAVYEHFYLQGLGTLEVTTCKRPCHRCGQYWCWDFLATLEDPRVSTILAEIRTMKAETYSDWTTGIKGD